MHRAGIAIASGCAFTSYISSTVGDELYNNAASEVLKDLNCNIALHLALVSRHVIQIETVIVPCSRKEQK